MAGSSRLGSGGWGGHNVSRDLVGGKCTVERAFQTIFGGLRIGIGWWVPFALKGKQQGVAKKRETYRRWGGPKTFLERVFFGIFPPPPPRRIFHSFRIKTIRANRFAERPLFSQCSSDSREPFLTCNSQCLVLWNAIRKKKVQFGNFHNDSGKSNTLSYRMQCTNSGKTKKSTIWSFCVPYFSMKSNIWSSSIGNPLFWALPCTNSLGTPLFWALARTKSLYTHFPNNMTALLRAPIC